MRYLCYSANSVRMDLLRPEYLLLPVLLYDKRFTYCVLVLIFTVVLDKWTIEFIKSYFWICLPIVLYILSWLWCNVVSLGNTAGLYALVIILTCLLHYQVVLRLSCPVPVLSIHGPVPGRG